jgi:hypothetical protein
VGKALALSTNPQAYARGGLRPCAACSTRGEFNRRVEEETASPDDELWLDSEDYQGGALENTG